MAIAGALLDLRVEVAQLRVAVSPNAEARAALAKRTSRRDNWCAANKTSDKKVADTPPVVAGAKQ